MSSLWEVECLVDDRCRVCRSDRSLQGADMAEEFFEGAWEGAGGSVTAQ